ncbi:MAG: hypothetical protein ACHREM_01525 [Polyangiales bacterium]
MNEILERKLLAVLDRDVEPSARATSAASRQARTRVKTSPTTTRTTPSKRAPRVSSTKLGRDGATLRDRILSTLDLATAPMGRAQLVAAVEVRPSEEATFGTALVRLRADKLIVLEGERRRAVYRCATIGEAIAIQEP